MEAASGPWCMRAYLEIAAATGCRRGELLALRWSDIQDGRLDGGAVAVADKRTTGV